VYGWLAGAEGTSVVRVRAVDADSGRYGQVRYQLDHTRTDTTAAAAGGRQFRVDADTGLVMTARLLDYELTQHYELIVIAADNASHSLHASALVSIHVTTSSSALTVYIQTHHTVYTPQP